MNNDLISRQQAIDAVMEYGAIWMEYTDAMSKDEIAQAALNNAKRTMIRIIKEQPTIQPEPKWIPVSERLPEPRIDVWVNSDLGQMVGYYDETVGLWYGRNYLELIVTAWMPLPEPYEEASNMITVDKTKEKIRAIIQADKARLEAEAEKYLEKARDTESYFGCGGPYDRQMKAAERRGVSMKRFDQIKQMDINELAGLLCEMHGNESECDACMVRDYCRPTNLSASLEDLKKWRCGFFHWLNEEVSDG